MPRAQRGLALLNALLTMTSLVLMLRGRAAIRRRDIPRHRRAMLGAVAAAALFVPVFVGRYVVFGPTAYQAGGVWRGLFLVLLASHEACAVASVPLVLTAVVLGWLRNDDAHREVASFTYPLWLYVTVTGIGVYLALYLRPW